MILGKRIRFRAIESADLPLLATWMNDPEISSSVVGWSFPVSAAEQEQWYQRSLVDSRNRRWMVETQEGEAIGLTGLWDIDWHNRHALTALKIGAKDLQGRGLGTDAIMTLMAYAFMEVGLNRLWGEMLPFNVGSYRAYVDRCGWKVEGVLKEHVFRHGAFLDLIRVGVTKADFVAHPRSLEYINEGSSHRIILEQKHMSKYWL